MTSSAMTPVARTIAPAGFSAVWPVLAAEAPVAAPLAEAVDEEFRSGGQVHSRFLTTSTPSATLLYIGSGVAPLRLRPGSAEAFAEAIVAGNYSRSSVHGRRADVEQLWPRLAPYWGPEREFRDRQLLLHGADQDSLAEAARECPEGCGRLRQAAVTELSWVLLGAAAMYREELGVDPLAAEFATGYRRRVARNLLGGNTWVLEVEGQLAFKLDVVARRFGVAAIQGVWTAPNMRGRGIATYGLATAMLALQARRLQPTLVVNADNAAARAVYRRCGMRYVDDYATVVF